MKNSDRVRYSLYLDPALSEYLESEVERLGISKSGFINMLISNDKMQKDVLRLSDGLSAMANKLIEIEQKINK